VGAFPRGGAVGHSALYTRHRWGHLNWLRGLGCANTRGLFLIEARDLLCGVTLLGRLYGRGCSRRFHDRAGCCVYT
jgi:hypothetical protein